eukprot:jgi/Mesen1/9203/ME000591S08529
MLREKRKVTLNKKYPGDEALCWLEKVAEAREDDSGSQKSGEETLEKVKASTQKNRKAKKTGAAPKRKARRVAGARLAHQEAVPACAAFIPPGTNLSSRQLFKRHKQKVVIELRPEDIALDIALLTGQCLPLQQKRSGTVRGGFGDKQWRYTQKDVVLCCQVSPREAQKSDPRGTRMYHPSGPEWT